MNRSLHQLVHHLIRKDNVTGGSFAQTGNPDMQTITPGNTPVFQVTPTFSGAPFALVAAQAAVTSSDPVNFPVALVAADPTGSSFEAAIPVGAVIPTGGETITVSWTYTNTDGTVATVTGTVTEQGIVDDVTGGTFAQIS
jgi:predicted ATP-grasp superfamily ATP-dependent carboligase